MPKLDELKAKVKKAQTDADIASLYILEADAHELFDEETLHGFYANILDLALENLTNALESMRKMKIDEVQDFATLRALYEYAIEHYSAGDIADASALFEVLSGLTEDKKFSDALQLHTLASQDKMSLDDFIDTIADVDATQKAGTFYISEFTNKAQNLLDKSQSKGK